MAARIKKIDFIRYGLIHLVVMNFVVGQLLAVHGTPHIGDVGDDKRNQQRHVEHRLQREHAARTVHDGKAALQVCGRRIVGRVVPSHAKEQCLHHQHHANAGRPNAPHVAIGYQSLDNTVEKRHDAHQKDEQQIPHFDEIIEIFERLHVDFARSRVVSEAFLEQRTDEEGEEKHEERHHIVKQMLATTLTDGVIIHIIYNIENAQHPGQKEDREAKYQVPRVEQRVKSVAGIGPMADNGLQTVRYIHLVDHEIAAIEERGHGATQQ